MKADEQPHPTGSSAVKRWGDELSEPDQGRDVGAIRERHRPRHPCGTRSATSGRSAAARIRLHDDPAVRCHGIPYLDRFHRRERPPRHGERRGASGRIRRCPRQRVGPCGVEHRRRRGDGGVLAVRRGPAPLRRPRRRRALPVHAVRARRLPPRDGLFRTARYEGRVHIRRACPRGLAGAVEPERGLGGRERRCADCRVRTDPATVQLHHRGRRRPLSPGRCRMDPR